MVGPFDLALYYPIPLLTTEGYITLCNALIVEAPPSPPMHIGLGITALIASLQDTKGGLVSRIDEDLSTGLERDFDVVADRTWMELRERLEFLSIYTHPGTAMFTAEDRAELEFDARVEQAHIAARLLTRLFGDGAEFLRAAFAQQAVHTASRLDWIDEKGLADTLTKMVGKDLTTLLRVCQRRYDAMVNARSVRDGKSVADLRELRDRLRRQIYSYTGLIGSMVDYSDPTTIAPVEKALRPILIARANAKRKLIGGEIPAEDVGAVAEDEAVETDGGDVDAPVESDVG